MASLPITALRSNFQMARRARATCLKRPASIQNTELPSARTICLSKPGLVRGAFRGRLCFFLLVPVRLWVWVWWEDWLFSCSGARREVDRRAVHYDPHREYRCHRIFVLAKGAARSHPGHEYGWQSADPVVALGHVESLLSKLSPRPAGCRDFNLDHRNGSPVFHPRESAFSQRSLALESGYECIELGSRLVVTRLTPLSNLASLPV